MTLRILGTLGFIFIIATLVAWDQSYRLPEAEQIEARKMAEALCVDRNTAEPQREFYTDGCTLFPNAFNDSSDYGHCCVRHDIEYWCGGTKEERKTADTVFLTCVKEKQPLAATMMYWSSWILSQPLSPTPWRWGYGYEYGGYTAKGSASTASEAPPTQ